MMTTTLTIRLDISYLDRLILEVRAAGTDVEVRSGLVLNFKIRRDRHKELERE